MTLVNYPVREPHQSFGAAAIDIGKTPVQTVTVIQFRAEEPVYQMTGEQIENRGLRYFQYVCYSCYAAYGDKQHCFATAWASRNNMRNGPIAIQHEQMKQHAEDHSVIWSWARSLDKK